MIKSSITHTTGRDWWLERVTDKGEQVYPERIRVGELDSPRVYVPERTCHMERLPHDPDYYVTVHAGGVDMDFDYARCSECGAHVADSPTLHYCPCCGAEVTDDAS